MTALNTDLARKGAPNWATTLEDDIASTDTTIPLDNVAGLPLDTAVTLTLDATDANGNETPDLKETVTGVVNTGSVSLVACLRGIDGTTAQSHDTGANAVNWSTAAAWNDFISSYLDQHTQLGAHVGLTTDTLEVTSTSVLAGAITGAGYSIATMANPCKFRVYLKAAAVSGNGAFAIVPFDTETFDTNDNFNPSTYEFTAPGAGFYQFNWMVVIEPSTAATLGSSLFQNGIRVSDGFFIGSFSVGYDGAFSCGGSEIVQCAEGDTIAIYSYANNGAYPLGYGTSQYTHFSGFLVSAT